MKEQRVLRGMLVLILLALAMVVGLTVRLSAHGKAYAQEPESALSAAEGLSTSLTYQEQLRDGSGPVRHTAVINSSVDIDALDMALSNTKLQTGNITIAKEAPGGGATLFYFGGDLGLMALADGYTGTQYNIPAGDYTVTETLPLPSGWFLMDVTCAGGDSTPYGDASGEGVEIHLDAGEHITCTFTNEHQIGNITIAKEAPGGGATLFYFGGDLGLMALADGYTGTQYNIPAGDYTITESVPSGWFLMDVTCVGGDSAPYGDASGEGVTIHLDAGEHITCIFTNLQISGILYLPLVARNYLGALDLVVQSVEATRPIGQTLADLSPRSNRAESGK